MIKIILIQLNNSLNQNNNKKYFIKQHNAIPNMQLDQEQ